MLSLEHEPERNGWHQAQRIGPIGPGKLQSRPSSVVISLIRFSALLTGFEIGISTPLGSILKEIILCKMVTSEATSLLALSMAWAP